MGPEPTRRRSARIPPVLALGPVVGLVLALVLPSAPATAATVPVYPGWSLLGGSGAWTGAVDTPAGFSTTTFESTSLAPATVPTGATTWLSPATPVGQTYGSSENRPYLNARPAANAAASPSTTTYAFDTATPPSGWAFVLGDVDADQVQVSATGPDGAPVPAEALGFAGTFNYCDVPSPRPSTCSGVVAPFDLPTWDPATAVLVGNPTATDTTGASGWFQPTVALRTLTLTFTWRAGFPVFQTWFAALTRDVTGTVTVDGAAPSVGTAVELVGPDGVVLAGTRTGPDGTYAFPGLSARAGYVVRVVPPEGFEPVGSAERVADLSTTDAVGTDFDLAAVPPPPPPPPPPPAPGAQVFPVEGTLTGPAGDPVAGAQVDLRDAVGAPVGSVSTDRDGRFALPPVPAGPYTLVVTPPTGLAPSRVEVVVPLAAPLELRLARSSAARAAPPARGAELAATGADGRLPGLGLGLVLLGGVLVGGTRRGPRRQG